MSHTPAMSRLTPAQLSEMDRQSRRERIATAALPAILQTISHGDEWADGGAVARRVLIYTDALIAELDKEQP